MLLLYDILKIEGVSKNFDKYLSFKRKKECKSMKKASAVLLTLLLVCMSLTGCGKGLLGNKVKVYSFSGETDRTEDRNIKISNGVIVLSPSEHIFYDGDIEGDLKPKQVKKDDNYEYSVTYWFRNTDGKEEILSMFSANVSNEFSTGPGSSRGGNFIDAEKLKNNLYCRIVIKNPDKTVSTYEIPLMLTEITKAD